MINIKLDKIINRNMTLLCLMVISLSLINASGLTKLKESIYGADIVQLQTSNNETALLNACNTASDCNYNGYCSTDHTTCICFSDYDTYNSNKQCNYHKYSQTTAFCLTFFFLPFGAGNWYTHRFDYAIPQLIIGILGMYFTGLVRASLQNNENPKVPHVIISRLTGLCLLGWWLADLIRYGKNEIPDDNGIYLAPW